MLAYADLMANRESNETVAEFVRQKIRSIVKIPKVAEMLMPSGFAIGAKRVAIDTGYFQTFNRPNVTLVNLRESPIEEVTPNGLRTKEQTHEIDCIVFATGFDAITGSLLKMNIHGNRGQSLADKWGGGPRTYLGIAINGFPNFFMITGPGSPSVLSNMVTSIEQHVDWIAQCLGYMRTHGYARIEASQQAEDEWVDHVNEVASGTLFPQANSWYVGANVPGKPRVFMPYVGGVGAYRAKCDAVAAGGYLGFTLSGINRSADLSTKAGAEL